MGTDVAKEELYIIGKTPGKEAILQSKISQTKKKEGEARATTEDQNTHGKAKVAICFWNVAGIKNKDRDFWDMVNKHDILGFTETWSEEKEWDKWKKKLPNTFAWKSKHVSRVKKKGRAKGGIITGIKHHLQEIQTETTYPQNTSSTRTNHKN
ncbi:hypothetical protein CBL_05172 [Carabus blaptoides fortunei]